MVAGCHITTHDGAYLVFVALRDADEIVRVAELPAPRAESEMSQLAGLRMRISDVLQGQQIQRLALWRYDGAQHATINAARPVIRAEGVVLGAAGDLGVDVVQVSPNSERSKAGVKTEELLASLTGSLRGDWKSDARRAVAASAYA